jgi:hypothetical protein
MKIASRITNAPENCSFKLETVNGKSKYYIIMPSIFNDYLNVKEINIIS